MLPTTEEVNKNDNKRNAASYYKAKTMANGTRLLAPGLPGTHLVSLVSKKVQIMLLMLLRTLVSVDKQRKIGLRQIMRKCDEKNSLFFVYSTSLSAKLYC